MHHLFTITELVTAILSECPDEATLYTAAMTCRTVGEVALDILWNDLESLGPLLSLLGPLEEEYDQGLATHYLVCRI